MTSSVRHEIQQWGAVEVLRRHYIASITEWLAWSRQDAERAVRCIPRDPDGAYYFARTAAREARIAISRTEAMAGLNHPRKQA